MTDEVKDALRQSIQDHEGIATSRIFTLLAIGQSDGGTTLRHTTLTIGSR